MTRYLILLYLLIFPDFTILFAQQHPHILVNNGEKGIILSKIEQQVWAGKIFSEMVREITPYSERHSKDPEWILSRYQMNRVPGKRYTKVYSDNGGLRMIKEGGDAPVPTVRVSPHIRGPVTQSGAGYRMPSIEDLVPYDTARMMNLVNTETGKRELIDPQAFVADINGRINDLALDASIIYWLKGDEKYAKFTADILDQWAKGAYYQEPVIGPCRTGFLDMQTLGDGSYRSLILAYDFVYPYMKEKGYDLKYYETVFEKFASTLAFRGFWNNNWYAAESSTLVFASLSLEDNKKKDYYLQFFLEKDTINGACGQLALPSTVEKWLTPDGHWKEPGGYHNYPVSNLLISSLALEKNGYDIFKRFPALFRASYAMLKYSFPNLTVSAFGDTGRASQSPESLEIGLIDAIKYNQPELPEMLASMKKLIEGGRYKRENSGFLGLLCFIPEIPAVKSEYSWPRSGTLDFAKYFLQRNGSDPQYGLMYGIQGASYNHNHCNGMAMELYGQGEVMGIDAGAGPTYEHPLHVNYYSQWAAHNTVVAAGASSSVPFSGSAGRKEIGQIELAAMEPEADKIAVSPLYSFTDTRYFDKSTGTSQMRTMAIIRNSPESGYYVDIYRSDNKISNDYVYHNIGDKVSLLGTDRKALETVQSDYPLTGKDYPGFRFFSDIKKLEGTGGNITALFEIKGDNKEELFMQVLLPGTEGRTYYTAKSLKTKTSGSRYAGKSLPLFTMRDNGESVTHPFIAVFEPYAGKDGYSVEKISVDNSFVERDFTKLTVFKKDNTREIILQSVSPEKKLISSEESFQGYFGVVFLAAQKLNSIYLGKGTEISYKGYRLKTSTPNGSASLSDDESNWVVSTNQPTEISFPFRKDIKIFLLEGSKKTRLKVKEVKDGISVNIPAVKSAKLIIE